MLKILLLVSLEFILRFASMGMQHVHILVPQNWHDKALQFIHAKGIYVTMHRVLIDSMLILKISFGVHEKSLLKQPDKVMPPIHIIQL